MSAIQPLAAPALSPAASEDDSKSLSSPVDDVKYQEEDAGPVFKKRGVIDVFLGRDRHTLQQDPIVFREGFGPFAASVKRRMHGVFTKRFLLCILIGQFLAFCLTATGVVTAQLGMSGWAMPVTQSLFFYVSLNLVYTSITIYKYGFVAWARLLLRSWPYILLAAVDVEANFLVIKAYGYTDLLSCQMLNAWATPACMIFAFFLVKARYHWSQVLGALICISGLALTVVSDHITDKNYPASNRVLGDILMLIGATGYGLSNALEERFVRERPLYEVIGQIGFWGCIINAIQGAGLEHDLFAQQVWSGKTIGLLIAYTAAMLSLYTLAPILFRLSSSPFYNLSIMTANVYTLLFGLRLYGYRPYFLYFIAYVFVITGLLIYFLVQTPEATAINVVARGKQLEKEKERGKQVIGENNI